jgi:hypothetical protein
MHITGNELTAASSAVAALAIIGGYLGVHSANQNALTISREERSSRRKEESDALKRVIYAKVVSDLIALGSANIEKSALHNDPKISPQARADAVKRRLEALDTAYNSAAELSLISSNPLLEDLAMETLDGASKRTREDTVAFNRGMSKLQVCLSNDLFGRKNPSADQLNRMVDNALAKQSSTVETTEATD